MKAVLLSAVWIYRRFVSPWFPPVCRFHPTCSQYVEDAIRRHGVLRGSLLAARRLARCRPMGPHGFDPVP